jgi:CRP-like cAMP-binding protein
MSEGRKKLATFIAGIYPMPLSQAEAIAARFSEKDFSKDDMILKSGKTCNEYYYLEDGYARAYTYDLDGNDVTTAFYTSNQVICELFSFFKRVPSRENIQALSDCKTWYLTFDGLQEVFHSLVEFREFGRTILINSYAMLKQRMLSTLHETAEERYGNLLRTNPEIFQHAPLKQIASYLGITDTSLSRIRKEISKNK